MTDLTRNSLKLLAGGSMDFANTVQDAAKSFAAEVRALIKSGANQ